MADVAQLQQRLAAALEAGDPGEVERLLAELSVAEKRRNRLLQRASTGPGGAFDVAPPIREQVASVLAILSRPASVSLIRDVATARFGEMIQPSRLASLRRDEQRSWQAAHRGTAPGARSLARPVYVVPALTFDRFAPVRGMLALSSWPLEIRLIAPASPRVDVLYAIIRLIGELDHSLDAPWAPNLRRLALRFGRTVAGSIEIRDGFDYTLIREAAERELRQILDADTAERAEAAQRARNQLDGE
ncbi:MAG: hypothetical protein QOE61_1520, partial [Micromonosporaceae bacterium]|nr:hypothetical protein [Micromonosporaceae bacterium]